MNEVPKFGLVPFEAVPGEKTPVSFELGRGSRLEVSQDEAIKLSSLIGIFAQTSPSEQIPDFELAKRLFGGIEDEQIALVYGFVGKANLILASKGLELHDDETNPNMAFYFLKKGRIKKGNNEALTEIGRLIEAKIVESQGIPEEELQKPLDARELAILALNLKSKNGVDLHLKDGTHVEKFTIPENLIQTCDALVEELRNSNMQPTAKAAEETRKEALDKLRVIFENEGRTRDFIAKHEGNGKILLDYLYEYKKFVLEVLDKPIESKMTQSQIGQPAEVHARRITISAKGAEGAQQACFEIED